jgi:hypothetical protein
MVETPRLQAKHVLSCCEATCHSGEGRNPGFPVKTGTQWMVSNFRRDDVWMPPYRVRGRLLKSGMTDDLITVENQLILINPSGPLRLADKGCSATPNEHEDPSHSTAHSGFLSNLHSDPAHWFGLSCCLTEEGGS